MGEEGLDLLAEVKQEFGIAVVTEVVSASHIKRVSEVADMLQIGSRNCQNYHLLEAVAGAGLPVLLKRGMASTVEEWISAAEGQKFAKVTRNMEAKLKAVTKEEIEYTMRVLSEEDEKKAAKKGGEVTV